MALRAVVASLEVGKGNFSSLRAKVSGFLLFCFVFKLLRRKGGRETILDDLMLRLITSVVVNVVYNVNGYIDVNGYW